MSGDTNSTQRKNDYGKKLEDWYPETDFSYEGNFDGLRNEINKKEGMPEHNCIHVNIHNTDSKGIYFHPKLLTIVASWVSFSFARNMAIHYDKIVFKEKENERVKREDLVEVKNNQIKKLNFKLMKLRAERTEIFEQDSN